MGIACESQRAITQYLEMMSYCANNHESAAHSTHSTPKHKPPARFQSWSPFHLVSFALARFVRRERFSFLVRQVFGLRSCDYARAFAMYLENTAPA